MSWMCKHDSGYSSPISIKGKSSWEDNTDVISDESPKEEADNNACDKKKKADNNACDKKKKKKETWIDYEV